MNTARTLIRISIAGTVGALITVGVLVTRPSPERTVVAQAVPTTIAKPPMIPDEIWNDADLETQREMALNFKDPNGHIVTQVDIDADIRDGLPLLQAQSAASAQNQPPTCPKQIYLLEWDGSHTGFNGNRLVGTCLSPEQAIWLVASGTLNSDPTQLVVDLWADIPGSGPEAVELATHEYFVFPTTRTDLVPLEGPDRDVVCFGPRDFSGQVGTCLIEFNIRTKTFSIPRPSGVFLTSSAPTALTVSGSTNQIKGRTIVAGSGTISGTGNQLAGLVGGTNLLSVGTNGNIINPPQITGYSHDVPGGVPAIADYAPGGSRVPATGYQAIAATSCTNGTWSATGVSLKGTIYVPCNVAISGANYISTATIIATGTITMDGSGGRLNPALDKIALRARAGITIAGSKQTIVGRVITEGPVLLSGSTNTLNCDLIGDTLALSGSTNTIIGQYCGATL